MNQPSDGGPDDEAEVPQSQKVPIENRNALDGMENMDWLSEQILKFDRRAICSLQMIAEAFLEERQFDKAEACSRMALRAIDQFHHSEGLRCDVLTDLARALRPQGRFTEAETTLREAYERADSHPLDLLTCWGVARELQLLLESQGKEESAIWKERAEILIKGKFQRPDQN